jgi:hypothetical protein
LLASRNQMERSLRVIGGLASDLDLYATPHRIVTAAMELTGARYAALGVRRHRQCATLRPRPTPPSELTAAQQAIVTGPQ